MNIGIIGLPYSGKTELFEALTGADAGAGVRPGNGTEHRAVVRVPDDRLERLAAVFQPKKKTAAVVEYVDFAGLEVTGQKSQGFSDQFLGKIRTADALLAVVRAFTDPAVPHPLDSVDPVRDLKTIEAELLLSDLGVVETRIARLTKELASKKPGGTPAELKALEKCRALLDAETPLRAAEWTKDENDVLRGYRFLTRKPLIVAVNVDEGDIAASAAAAQGGFRPWLEKPRTSVLALSAKIEREIQQLEEGEARAFLKDFGLDEPARTRLIAESYRLLGRISFFTVGEDEVKAWTVRGATPAVLAAGAVHSDIARGFIRAEVVAYGDFIARPSLPDCRTDGTLRLEGKDYPVADGDIINFRFAV